MWDGCIRRLNGSTPGTFSIQIDRWFLSRILLGTLEHQCLSVNIPHHVSHRKHTACGGAHGDKRRFLSWTFRQIFIFPLVLTSITVGNQTQWVIHKQPLWWIFYCLRHTSWKREMTQKNPLQWSAVFARDLCDVIRRRQRGQRSGPPNHWNIDCFWIAWRPILHMCHNVIVEARWICPNDPCTKWNWHVFSSLVIAYICHVSLNDRWGLYL